MSPESKPAARACSAADALAVVGDRYALLVVREILYGSMRFGQIAANTGAPRDVLTSRLRKLEREGIIMRRRYSERPERYEYLLTLAGRELEPVILALSDWGDRHLHPGEEPVVFEHSCGARFHAVMICAACGEPIVPGELTVTGGREAAVGASM